MSVSNSAREALYLIGEPGVGKSTLADALIGTAPLTVFTSPFAHYTAGPVVVLGVRRKQFPGTDALPMNVQPKVEGWLDAAAPPLLFGEGDRLGNDKFFRALTEAGYNLVVGYLVGEATAKARRKERGSKQNDAWVRGRGSKAAGLADRWRAIRLPAAAPTEGHLDALVRASAVAAALRRASGT